MASTIGEFLIGLGFELDEKDLTEANKKAQASAKKMQAAFTDAAKQAGKAFAVIGAAALGAAGGVFKLVDAATQSGDAIAKGARAAGLSADSFQKLQFAAGRSGVEMQAVSVSVRKLQSLLLDVSQGRGSQAFIDSLTKIGLSAEALNVASPEQQLGLIGDALSNIGDPARRTALSMKILGEEGGPKLASLLDAGSEGIAAMTGEAERLGLILGDEALSQAEEFQDQLGDLKGTVAAVGRELGFELLPIVREVIVEVKDWIVQNKALIRERLSEFLQKTAAFAREFFGVLKDLGPSIGQLVELVVSLAGAIGSASGGTGLIVSLAAARIGLSQVGVAAAGALGPIGLLAVAVAGMATAFITSQVAAQDAAIALDELQRFGGRTATRGAPKGFKSASAGRQITKAEQDIAQLTRKREQSLDTDSPTLFETVRTARPALGGRTTESIDREIAKKRAQIKRLRAQDQAFGFLEQGVGAPKLLPQASAGRRARGGGGGRKTSSASATDPTTPTASTDPLSAILGDPNAPDAPLNEVTKERTPQVLISNVYNTINVDQRVDVSGAGDPGSVADMVVKRTRDFYRVDLKRASKFATVGDLR